MNIVDLLASDNYVIFNRTIAKKFGIETAIVFGTLCGYQRSFGGEEFYREQEKIIADTCLTEYMVRRAIKTLSKEELIIVTKKGLPAKNYFKLNEEKIISLLVYSCVKRNTTSGVKFDTTK